MGCPQEPILKLRKMPFITLIDLRCGFSQVPLPEGSQPATALVELHASTVSHAKPSNFERMRVSLAFRLFGDTVIYGTQLNNSNMEKECTDSCAVKCFE